jgi:hypothetical protein
MIAHVALHLVLGALALYHLGIGVASLLSFEAVSRIARPLYGLDLQASVQLRYAVRMLGLYALALGTLLAFAALQPRANRNVILVVAGLQLARALSRVVFRHELASAFHVPLRRNALNAAVLVAEAAVLLVALPYAR